MQGGIVPPFAPGGSRNRNNSMNDAMLRANSGPPSPTSSRPRTPPGSVGPSSEVTPWVFQDTQQVRAAYLVIEDRP